MNDESTKYCEQCYSRNNSLLLNPVVPARRHDDQSNATSDPNNDRLLSLFRSCGLISAGSRGYPWQTVLTRRGNHYTTTPRGFQFLLMTFHDQVGFLLQHLLAATANPVPFFSFLFNLPQMTPRMPYRVAKLTPEQTALFPLFHLVGLV